MIEVASLHAYPVKSLGGVDLQDAALGMRGFEYDRTWMVTDANGRFLTQRQLPAMATVRTLLTAAELVLESDRQGPLQIPLSSAPRPIVRVTVWKDTCDALDEGDHASAWLTAALGTWRGGPLRLVRFAEDFSRPVNPGHSASAGHETAFADGYPYLVTSEESLALLNAELQRSGSNPVGMNRFRPNIVVKGLAAPFAEDSIQALCDAGAGAFRLELIEPCQRCKITSIDQRDGSQPDPKEPLRTLVKLGSGTGLKGAYFGQNAVLANGAGSRLAVGDELSAV